MKNAAALCLFGLLAANAAPRTHADSSVGSQALTIYNQNFSVVRQTVPLTLTKGDNKLSFSDITAHVEPDSVVLRDPSGKHDLRILEQNYRADPISQDLLLNLYEGKTIDFQANYGSTPTIIKGKIIRSGYVPHTDAYSRYGQQYAQMQQSLVNGGAGQPIIEVDGKLLFSLPGTPIFPALTDDSLLKPAFDWLLSTNTAGSLDAELAYITGGMTWSADYNVVSPENGNEIDLVGWVTMDNESGKAFENAHIKLMAGDVNKLNPNDQPQFRIMNGLMKSEDQASPAVTEKAFDEYHLYTLQRPTTLRDRETKQVEFVRGSHIASNVVYIYDGAWIDPNRYGGWNYDTIRENREYGTQSNPKVWTMREFVNSQANGLGIPLPKGRLRFYRRDADGQLEFTGENEIDHTPKDETVRVFTGNAFDIAGERTQTDYKYDSSPGTLDESFAITLRNHKTTPVEVRVVEHLYRWPTWKISATSQEFKKTDAHTIEYKVSLAPNEEKKVTYTAHYTW